MKTILERLGMTQDELEDRYREVRSYRALASELGVSKTTLQKYLSEVAATTKPWQARHLGYHENPDYYRKKFRKESIESFERALLGRKTWVDVNGRRIPREAVSRYYIETPKRLTPIIPVYARLRDGQQTIFLFHPNVGWISGREQEEHSSDEGSPDTSLPSPSEQFLDSYSVPEENPE